MLLSHARCTEVPDVTDRPDARELPSQGGPLGIEFRDVRFAYPSRKNLPVLKGVSFTIPAGLTPSIFFLFGLIPSISFYLFISPEYLDEYKNIWRHHWNISFSYLSVLQIQNFQNVRHDWTSFLENLF